MRELTVGLMKHSVLEVGRLHARLLQNGIGCTLGGIEVGLFTCESATVLGIELVLPPPEIRHVGHVRVREQALGDQLFGTHDERRGTRRGREFQRIGRRPLRGVARDAQGVLHLPRLHMTERHVHRFGSRLAGELEVGAVDVGRGTDGLCHRDARRLHGVWMRLRADVDRTDVGGIDVWRACQGTPCRLHRQRDRVHVRWRNGFFAQHQSALVAGRVRTPDLRDLLNLDAMTGQVCAVADNTSHYDPLST